jgi:hypothetical protein
MIHIVFNEVEVNLLKEVIALDETLAGPVLQIKDDYAVGPIQQLDTEEGKTARLDWWKGLLAQTPYGEQLTEEVNDAKTVEEIQAALNADPELECWIWMGQNQHDVTGYFWLMPQLREFQGRVMIIYLNNLPFINEKGQIFYPSWLSEIQPSEFLKAKKLARPITLSEYEIDPDEWRKMAEENAIVRILEGGKKIVGKQEDFYDAEITKNLTGDWQKATRVITNTLHRMKIKTGDVFLMWRLKELIQSGKVIVNGEPSKSWKDFDVKLFGAKSKGVVEENQEN